MIQIPRYSGHGQNLSLAGGRGEHGVPQPLDSALGCRGRSPPSRPPFPRPGKPGLRGQMGQSCSGVRSSPPPPSSSISGPFMAIGSGRAAAGVASQPAQSLPGRGKGHRSGPMGMPRRQFTLHSPRASGPATEQQHFRGTVSSTLPSLLCACFHALGWIKQGILTNI